MFTFVLQEIEEPSRKKLLPEPLQAPFIQPPYTLVMEITGLLVKPEWTVRLLQYRAENVEWQRAVILK